MEGVNKPRASWFLSALERPAGLPATLLVMLVVSTAPAWLFFDPVSPIPRDPLQVYRLHSDDYAYIASSRTLSRTVSNLFVPHNTHVVPAWRLVCWAASAASGKLERLPEVLAVASYGILVAVMLMAGRIVARETGRMIDGLVVMAVVGATSLMRSPACWFSAGQTLWAGFGILATLHYLQNYRISAGTRSLICAAFWALISGWFWTIGYIAGPAGALYLWLDGRPRCVRGAIVPLAASVVAASIGFGLGGRQIDSRVSFHGRTVKEAANPLQGVLHTMQAIPENLALGTLGLTAETTEMQGVVLTSALFLSWAWSRRDGFRFNPLECSGALILVASYLVEWTARGYLPFSSLRGIVPWYDTVPEIGAVLFVAGWVTGPRGSIPTRRPILPSRLGLIAVTLLTIALVVVNRPRVEALWAELVPHETARERKLFKIPSLKRMRNNNVLFDMAEWHRRNLKKLDAAERMASHLGIDRDAIRKVFGRVDAPELPAAYDAADLLVLPHKGTLTDPDSVRRALAPFFVVEPPPRPKYLSPTEIWPPLLEDKEDAEK